MDTVDGSIESLFGFYEFTSGRRLYALRKVRTLAHEEGFTELVKHCDAAVAHEGVTREIERRWAAEPADTKANPAAQKVDILVDRTLGAIRDHAVVQAQGAAPDDPIHAQVEAFLKRIFPVSVFDVTSMPFIEESEAVNDIVALLKGELAPTVKDLGLGRLAKRLAELAVEYKEALDAPPPSLVAWGKVRAARAEGQGMLLEAVAIIVGKHHKRTPEGMAARVRLLDPILKQNDAIGQYLRARRTVADVDPETGSDQPDAPGGAKEPSGAKDPKDPKGNG